MSTGECTSVADATLALSCASTRTPLPHYQGPTAGALPSGGRPTGTRHARRVATPPAARSGGATRGRVPRRVPGGFQAGSAPSGRPLSGFHTSSYEAGLPEPAPRACPPIPLNHEVPARWVPAGTRFLSPPHATRRLFSEQARWGTGRAFRAGTTSQPGAVESSIPLVT